MDRVVDEECWRRTDAVFLVGALMDLVFDEKDAYSADADKIVTSTLSNCHYQFVNFQERKMLLAF